MNYSEKFQKKKIFSFADYNPTVSFQDSQEPWISKYQQISFFCTNWNLLIKLLRVPETSNAAPVSSKSSRKLQSGVLVGAPGIQ
jgi:hypothetical protein